MDFLNRITGNGNDRDNGRSTAPSVENGGSDGRPKQPSKGSQRPPPKTAAEVSEPIVSPTVDLEVSEDISSDSELSDESTRLVKITSSLGKSLLSTTEIGKRKKAIQTRKRNTARQEKRDKAKLDKEARVAIERERIEREAYTLQLLNTKRKGEHLSPDSRTSKSHRASVTQDLLLESDPSAEDMEQVEVFTQPQELDWLAPVIAILSKAGDEGGLVGKLNSFVKEAMGWKERVDHLSQRSNVLESRLGNLEGWVDQRLVGIETQVRQLAKTPGAPAKARAKEKSFADAAKTSGDGVEPRGKAPPAQSKPAKALKSTAPKDNHLVLLKPKQPDQKALGSKLALRSLCGRDMPNVTSVQVGRGGVLKYLCATADGKEALKSLVLEKGSDKFTIVEPTKLRPRLRLTGVLDSDKSKWPEVLAEMLRKNEGLEVKLSEAIGDAAGGVVTAIKAVSVLWLRGVLTWVLETSPKVRAVLLAWDKVGKGKGRVFLDGTLGRFEDHVSVPCCGKCFSLDHLKVKCTEEKALCGRCGSSEHLRKDCKAEARCPNCVKQKKVATHEAEGKCPLKRAREEKLRRMIDYGV